MLRAEKLVIKGSDTLGAKWVPMLAEAFKAQNPDTTFEIAAEGSTTGIAAITDGTCEIAMSSRRAKSTEISAAKAKGVDMHETIVCFDALGVIVNASNPIPSLTKRQVEQIFTGDITDWADVGGTAGTISIYTRNTASGTYQDFKDLAMSKRDYAPSSQKMAGHEQIAAEVGKNALGIGYVGIAYFGAAGIKIVPIDVGGTLITPSRETVLNKTYPYFRPNYFYTNGKPSGLGEKFINFIFTPEGHKVTEQVHFVPGDAPFTVQVAE
ncbi:MAG: phosphate ABC transporter substrate-binding protein [Candidatus Methylacidiphilales bacterium]|nr:phosphate ABC transporter substrate-binding protein [Candidatus Methylacidiphilales bacterium]